MDRPYAPGNVQANLYRQLGINPSLIVPDYNQLRRYILKQRDVGQERVE